MMKEDRLKKLKKVLLPLLHLSGSEWHISSLQGSTNQTYLLSDGKRKFVVRVPADNTAFITNLKEELTNLAFTTSLGLAPPLYYSDLKNNILVTEYVEKAKSLEEADFAKPEIQQRIGEVLRKLQQSGALFQGKQDPVNAIDTYLAFHQDPMALHLRWDMTPLLEFLQKSTHIFVPSHIDPNPSNFLLCEDGRLLLIDWEFSAEADPCWDVAAILNFMPQEEKIRHKMAKIIFDDDSPLVIARLTLFQAALLLVAGSWAAMEAAKRQDSALALLAQSYFDRCHSFLKTKEVAEAREILC